MDISIIIVSFDTNKMLDNCIEPICKKANCFNFEIIVVDNALKDGSTEMLDDEFREVKLVKNTDKNGFASADNLAIRIATGRYIPPFYSEPVLNEKTIETSIYFMEKH